VEALKRKEEDIGANPSLTAEERQARHQHLRASTWTSGQGRALGRALADYREAESILARREQARRRRERILDSLVSLIDRGAIYRRDRGRCWICGRLVPRKKMTLDHVVALIKGGEHVPDNLRVAHRICNLLKGPRRRVAFWCMKCLSRWPRGDGSYLSKCSCGARWHANANNWRGKFRTR